MMNRRAFIVGGVAVFFVPRAGEPQHTGSQHRIGFLSFAEPQTSGIPAPFRDALGKLGYFEGQNLTIEFRGAGGREDRLPALAADLSGLKLEVIVATTTPAAVAAKRATRRIPIVFIYVGDPVATGLVTTLSHPGGNITGLTTAAPELSGKRLQLLKEAVPAISRIAVLANRANPASDLQLREITSVARLLSVKLQVVHAGGEQDLDGAFAVMLKERAEGLVVAGDPVFVRERARIARLAVKHRLPAIFQGESGGLLSYAPSRSDVNRHAAVYVDKILRGAKPADLPVEQPTKFELVINLKTAKALGLAIPPSLLLRADQVIE